MRRRAETGAVLLATLLACGALLLPLAGCDGCAPEEPPPAESPPGPEPAPPTAEAEPAEAEPAEEPPPDPVGDEAPRVTARVRVVDIQGSALAGIVPIACREPNAFSPPVARGPRTGEDGRSHLTFDATEDLHIRGWDPDLHYFSNSYETYIGRGAPIHDELTLLMVRGARLAATLADPGHQPVRGEEVALMMYHPTRGPWWPTEARTDEYGMVDFGRVPAGQFVLELRTAGGLGIQLPETPLQPGQSVDLGLVVLR